jgi:hypothetical protein
VVEHLTHNPNIKGLDPATSYKHWRTKKQNKFKLKNSGLGTGKIIIILCSVNTSTLAYLAAAVNYSFNIVYDHKYLI